MAVDAPRARAALVVPRFGRSERVLHWAHAGAFMVMLATGLVLYLPFLAQVVSARPLMKAVHLAAAVAWLAALALVALLGDRRALRRSRRELERFDDDDLRWLRGGAGARARVPQGRFNAGQKVHTVVQAAMSVLLVVSGTLLWLGERDTALRFSGTLPLHDMAMAVATLFVLGHVYMAFAPDTRPALTGMTGGSVPASYARSHHAKWEPGPQPPPAPHPSPARRAAAAVVVALAVAGATLLVRDVFVGDAGPPRPALSAAGAGSASPPAGTSAGSGTGTAAARSPR